MNDYVNLFRELKPGLLDFYGTNESYVTYNPHAPLALKYRTHLHHLLLIEMVLKQHRDKYKKSISDLSGIKALHHMAFLKTNWKPEEIRATPINDLLFVLQDEINTEGLPEEDRNYLKTILNNDNPPKIDLASYTGWQIAEGDQHLENQW
ncbi:hypothetical protein ABVK36_03560 [Lonsdalea quercina]|uniref:ECs1072 family phage-associated protein n=1 Tax=Lonsdalea quercina TaxID=71657 RepID=UPI003F48952D